LLKYDIENEDALTKAEFLSKAEVSNLKTYPERQVKLLAAAHNKLMEKAETEELSGEENAQMKIFKAELESLKKITVLDDDLKKETLYYRSKSEISKADTIENEFKAQLEQDRYKTLSLGFANDLVDEKELEKALGKEKMSELREKLNKVPTLVIEGSLKNITHDKTVEPLKV
jgi:hypothetical protein